MFDRLRFALLFSGLLSFHSLSHAAPEPLADYLWRLRSLSLQVMVDYCYANAPSTRLTVKAAHDGHKKQFRKAIAAWVKSEALSETKVDLEERSGLLKEVAERSRLQQEFGPKRDPIEYCRDVASSMRYPADQDFSVQIKKLFELRQSPPTKVMVPGPSCVPEAEYAPAPEIPTRSEIAPGTYVVVGRMLVTRSGGVADWEIVQGKDRHMRKAVLNALEAHRFKAHSCGTQDGVWVERTFTFTYE